MTNGTDVFYSLPITTTSFATTTIVSSAPPFFGMWVDGPAGTNTSTNIVLWQRWVNEYQERLLQQREQQQDRAERAAQVRAQWEAQARAEQARAAVIRKRAEAMLRRHLTAEQRRERRAHGYFYVWGSEGGLYRIDGGTHGNVRVMQENADGSRRVQASYCGQPDGVPTADAHLAQLLMIRHNEAEFRRRANRRAW